LTEVGPVLAFSSAKGLYSLCAWESPLTHER